LKILQENSQQEASEEDESESDGKARPSTESSVTEEGYADIGGDEDTTPAAEENAALMGEERIIEPNAKDGHVEQQGDEEQSQSFTDENAEVEGSTEFVPDEPEHKKVDFLMIFKPV